MGRTHSLIRTTAGSPNEASVPEVSDRADRDDAGAGGEATLRSVSGRGERCWFHKIANVLNALPKSAQPGAKAVLAEIYNAEDREHAEHAATAFAEAYGAKWPKACGSSVASRRRLRPGCQLALRLRVGVVDPGAKRRFWD